MANIKSFPNNQDTYIGAKDVMKWLHGRTSGVFAAQTNLAVSALSTPAMAVTVSDGIAWMSNSSGDGVVAWNDYVESNSNNGNPLQLSIDAASGVQGRDRIDRIIVEWETTNYVAYPEIKVLRGDTSSAPVAKSLTNNSTKRQISLAKINVAADTTAITSSMITDERLDSTVCGIVTDSLSIDTTTAQNQFVALLNAVEEELGQLEAETAVELKKRSYSNVTVGTGLFVADSTYEDYPFRANVALDGMTGNDIPEVIFGYDAVKLGILAPFCESHTGGVYIYATEVPANSITIPTIIAWKP